MRYSVFLAQTLMAFLLLGSNTILFSLHVVAEELHDSWELCAFSGEVEDAPSRIPAGLPG